MERCPCCDARLNGATLCPRCGCDLEKAAMAERDAGRWLEQAVRLWLGGDASASLKALDRSLRLKRTELARTLHAHVAARLTHDERT